jgi:hypothetical protein
MERSIVRLFRTSIAGAIVSGSCLLVAPSAQAGTLTFGYSNGNFNASATANPFILSAVNSFLGQSLPSSVSVNGSNLQGIFTVLDDPAQFQDGDITVDYAFLDAVFGSYIDSLGASLPGLASLSDAQREAALDTIFDYSLTGTGTLSNANGGSTNFAVNYQNGNNSIVIDGFDTSIATSCLTLTCSTTASGGFGLTASALGVLTVANQLSSPLPPETLLLLQNLSGLGSFPVLTGNFTYRATTALLSSNPSGTTLAGDLQSGTITTTRTSASGEISVTDRNLANSTAQQVPEPMTGLALVGSSLMTVWKRRQKANAENLSHAV